MNPTDLPSTVKSSLFFDNDLQMDTCTHKRTLWTKRKTDP